jgi:hypothetical protein
MRVAEGSLGQAWGWCWKAGRKKIESKREKKNIKKGRRVKM